MGLKSSPWVLFDWCWGYFLVVKSIKVICYWINWISYWILSLYFPQSRSDQSLVLLFANNHSNSCSATKPRLYWSIKISHAFHGWRSLLRNKKRRSSFSSFSLLTLQTKIRDHIPYRDLISARFSLLAALGLMWWAVHTCKALGFLSCLLGIIKKHF